MSNIKEHYTVQFDFLRDRYQIINSSNHWIGMTFPTREAAEKWAAKRNKNPKDVK